MKSVKIFFLLLVFSLTVLAEVGAESDCRKGPFCLKIENVYLGDKVAKQDDFNFVEEDFLLYVVCLCHKWRSKAHNLHVAARIKEGAVVHDSTQRRLDTLGAGEKRVKILEFKNLAKGKYTLEVVFKDLNNPVIAKKNFQIIVI